MLINIVRNTLLRHKSVLFKRYNLLECTYATTHTQNATVLNNQCTKKEKNDDDDDDNDKPIKYSQSKAATMKVTEYRDPDDDAPSYQSDVVSLSLAVFLIYFCILREENDIDLILDVDLKDRLQQLAEMKEQEMKEQEMKKMVTK